MALVCRFDSRNVDFFLGLKVVGTKMKPDTIYWCVLAIPEKVATKIGMPTMTARNGIKIGTSGAMHTNTNGISFW